MPQTNKGNKFQNFLDQFKLSFEIKELPVYTRTAEEASKAIGCQLAQIAKSIIFKTIKTQKPILVIASGANRINEEKIAKEIGEPIEKADASFVLEQTGFIIGGVPPFGHIQKILTFIDQDLTHYEEIWAAAGSPQAVFKLTAQELIEITAGKVIAVS